MTYDSQKYDLDIIHDNLEDLISDIFKRLIVIIESE